MDTPSFFLQNCHALRLDVNPGRKRRDPCQPKPNVSGLLKGCLLALETFAPDPRPTGSTQSWTICGLVNGCTPESQTGGIKMPGTLEAFERNPQDISARFEDCLHMPFLGLVSSQKSPSCSGVVAQLAPDAAQRKPTSRPKR